MHDIGCMPLGAHAPGQQHYNDIVGPIDTRNAAPLYAACTGTTENAHFQESFSKGFLPVISGYAAVRRRRPSPTHCLRGFRFAPGVFPQGRHADGASDMLDGY